MNRDCLRGRGVYKFLFSPITIIVFPINLLQQPQSLELGVDLLEIN
jgi:hypothetical protein